MFANFDFDVIRRSFAYLFIDGMTFTLMLTGLSASSRAFDLSVDLLSRQPELFAPLHTHSFELADAAQAIDTLANSQKNRSICVSLKPDH